MYVVVLFGTSFSGYTLLSASLAAADSSDVKYCLRMNACCAHEYTVFRPAQLLCTWYEQQPTIQGDLDSNTAG